MKYESVAQMFQRYHRDKTNGVKHTPLHTLQECCEEAGIDPRLFGRYAAQHPNAPQPVFNSSKNVGRGAVKYYRKHDFVLWVNQIRKQKEKEMPDIKTALQQALAKTATEWAADDEAHQQIQQQEKTVPTTINISATDAAPINTPKAEADKREDVSVSRTTFEYVRDNPGLTVDQITNALVAQGYNPKSVSSLCYQMRKIRLIVSDANGKMTAVVREYEPIQTNMRRMRKAKIKAKPVRNKAPAPAPVVEAPTPRKHVQITNTRTGEIINPRKEEWTVESVIGSLNVRQAMAVYDELRKIFGG